jgi:hypothetical protein
MKTRPIVPRERKDMFLSISVQENDWRKMGKGSTSRKEDMSRYLNRFRKCRRYPMEACISPCSNVSLLLESNTKNTLATWRN